MHFTNCSITLTYSPEHLPATGSLDHTHFQNFIRKLRNYYRPLPIRYYMGGEYGEQTGRPHYHAVLFGIEPHDKIAYSKSNGFQLWESATLDNCWGLGKVLTGDLTFESAAYIARYIMKKRLGDEAHAWYEKVDVETGEITKMTPEYNRMSTHPGLGKHWLDKYWGDVYPHGKIVVRSDESQAPRYYDKQLKKRNPQQLDLLKQQREAEGLKKAHDNTPERRAVKEQVAQARLNQLKRGL